MAKEKNEHEVLAASMRRRSHSLRLVLMLGTEIRRCKWSVADRISIGSYFQLSLQSLTMTACCICLTCLARRERRKNRTSFFWKLQFHPFATSLSVDYRTLKKCAYLHVRSARERKRKDDSYILDSFASARSFVCLCRLPRWSIQCDAWRYARFSPVSFYRSVYCSWFSSLRIGEMTPMTSTFHLSSVTAQLCLKLQQRLKL